MSGVESDLAKEIVELQCLTRRVVQAYLDLGILHTIGRV